MIAIAFDKPHRPDTTDTRYTLWTEKHDAETADLNPCESKLYRWLLERACAGTEFDLDLEDFKQFTRSARRPEGYHLNHIIRALNKLVEAGFVITRQFVQHIKRVTRVIVRHAGEIRPVDLPQRKSFTRTQKVSATTEKLQAGTSNPDSAVPSFRESSEKTTNTAVVALSKNEEPGTPPESPQSIASLESPAASENDSLSQENPEADLITESVAAAGIQLNATLRALVLKHTIAEVLGALALYQEAKKRGEVKKPEGWFTDACEGRWWEKDAPGTGAIVAVSPVADVDWTQHPDWETWLHFMRTRSVPDFRREAGDQFGLDWANRNAIIKFAEENNLIWVGDYGI